MACFMAPLVPRYRYPSDGLRLAFDLCGSVDGSACRREEGNDCAAVHLEDHGGGGGGGGKSSKMHLQYFPCGERHNFICEIPEEIAKS